MFSLKLFLIFAITAVASSASAGVVTPNAALIRSKIVSEDRTAIEYCEQGECYDLTPAKGYTIQEWEQVANFCDQYSYLGRHQTEMISNGIIIAITASKVAVSSVAKVNVVTKFALIAAVFLFDGKVNEQDAAIASDMMIGVARPGDNKFSLKLDHFISLRNGLADCTKEYGSRRRKYQRGFGILG